MYAVGTFPCYLALRRKCGRSSNLDDILLSGSDCSLGPLFAICNQALLMENTVKALRKSAGWSQQEMAEHLGVSRQSIISIERGRFDPSLDLAIRIARIFNKPVQDIFFPEDKP